MNDFHPSDRPVRVRHLCPEDARVLDALLGALNQDEKAGLAQERDGRRTRRVQALLALLDSLPNDAKDEDEPHRVQRTLDAVQAARERARFLIQWDARPASEGGGGWRQVGVIAIVLIMGLSLLLPVLDRNRAQAQRLACASQLHAAGEGFTAYAAEHNDTLPRGRVEPGSVWWLVGQVSGDHDPVRSNSAHLYLLVRGRYVSSADTLACPTNVHAPIGEMTVRDRDWRSPREVSYSYQNQYIPEPWRISDHPHMAVLADKNPLFVARAGRIYFDDDSPVDTPSRGHSGHGQNVLTMDGVVTWTVRPFLHRPDTRHDDNIWLARGIRVYQGNEQPSGGGDAFLVP